MSEKEILKNVKDFLDKNPHAWLIWYSSIDKPRSTYAIQKAWEYRSSGALYKKERFELKDNMEKFKLLDFNGLSIFDWIPYYVKKSFPDIKIDENHFEKVLSLLDQEYYRNFLFKIEKITALYENYPSALEATHEYLIYCFMIISSPDYQDRKNKIKRELISSKEIHGIDLVKYLNLLEEDFNEEKTKALLEAIMYLIRKIIEDNRRDIIDFDERCREKLEKDGPASLLKDLQEGKIIKL